MDVSTDLIALANRLADTSGAVIRPLFRQRIDVAHKQGRHDFDPVTEADKGGEKAIRAIIERERPDDGILGEELGEKKGTNGLRWVLDPVDGTRAFITGRHTWGTLVALHDGTRPVLGIIDQPILRERFIGHSGKSEMITADGREPLRVRACSSLSQAVVSTTHPWSYFDRGQRGAFETVCEEARMSYFGGDCYGYALLAMGFIDVIIEGRLAPWDVAALIPVIEGAGGIVTDWDGRPFANGASVIAAGDRRTHAEALKLLKGKG